MVVFEIPTSASQTWYVQTVTLSGVTYRLELRYNTRMQRWILNILDAGDTPILMGQPLLINRNLTGQYTQLSLPEGTMFCVDDSGNNLQPTLASFLIDHAIIYLDPTVS